MHASVHNYVQWALEVYDPKPSDVLEVGAYNVNGSVRHLFDAAHYTGVDTRAGPDVDIVIDPSTAYTIWREKWDVVVSTETLEHDLRPWRTMRHMRDWVRPGGLVIVTARGFSEKGFTPYHAHPGDFWRFTVEGMRALMEDCLLEVLDCRRDPWDPGVLGTAKKWEKRTNGQ